MKRIIPVILAIVFILSAIGVSATATTVDDAQTDAVLLAAEDETAVLFAAADDGATEDDTTAAATVEETAGEKEKEGITARLANWFSEHLSGTLGGALTSFIVSLFPILECRGGMIVAKACNVQPFWYAFLLCYVANMIPVPFILLFIKQIFKFMKKHNILRGFIEKLEGKGEKNRDKILRYKQWGLLLFVAVPLPGTGAWTGSLFAALLDIDFKKALPIVAIGVFIADLIMTVVTYGAGAIFNF